MIKITVIPNWYLIASLVVILIGMIIDRRKIMKQLRDYEKMFDND